MFKININKIYGKMAEKDLTRLDLAARLGITTQTLRIYLKEPERMPYRIVDQMADELCDGWDEAKDIFFAENLRESK